MKTYRLLIVFAGCLTLQATASPPRAADPVPIVIRHDRADARYLELGAQFPAVGKVGRGGDGTLIAPDWVLTAAHVARGMQRRGPDLRVHFGNQSYGVAYAVLHPDWTDMGPHDIALLRLEGPVVGIEPLPIYSGEDERDQVATLVGHGDTRTGMGGAWLEDGQRRAATNRIDQADRQWLYFTFDEPPEATDLEGTPGRGDSGGPALLLVEGRPFVAGVSSLGRDGKHGPGTYGAVDHFVRVSSYQDWIRQTMAAPPPETIGDVAPSDAGEVVIRSGPAGEAALPDNPAGRHMAAFIDLLSDGEEAALADFIQAHFAASALAERSTEERRPAMWGLVEDLRGATLRQVVRAQADDVEVILALPAGENRVLRFRCEAAAPHGIRAVMTGRIGRD